MAVSYAVGKLVRLPKGKNVTFQTLHPRSGKYMYPEFYLNQFAEVPAEWEEGKDYLISFSISNAIHKDTKKDLGRGQLFLKSAKPHGFRIDDERCRGVCRVKGMVDEIKTYTIQQPQKIEGVTEDFTFHRIKLYFDMQHFTYVWYFSPTCDLVKGDRINSACRLFNKRAYNSVGEIDMSPDNVYENAKGETVSRWYTELELVNWEMDIYEKE